MQAQYTKPIACGICLEKHPIKECQNLNQPKYAACQGPHCVTNAGCREYLKIKADIQQKAQITKGKSP